MFSNKYPLKLPHSKLIAHRGNYGDDVVPENTLAAVKQSHEHRMKWVECDVKLTADHILIVIHDETLKRTTTAQGHAATTPVSQMTYAEIVRFDTVNRFSKVFPGEKIPQFVDYLQLIQKLNMGLLLEIKPSKGFEKETTQKALEILEQFKFLNSPRLMVQSFYVESLQEAKRLNPKLNLGLLLEEWGVYTRQNTGLYSVRW